MPIVLDQNQNQAFERSNVSIISQSINQEHID